MAQSKTTRNHEEIRRWAEDRGGVPAEVASTERNGEAGILRLEFPNAKNSNDANLKEISWDEFFAKFDDKGLELLYREETAGGDKSNFNKLIYPDDEEHSSRKSGSGKNEGRNSGRSAA